MKKRNIFDLIFLSFKGLNISRSLQIENLKRPILAVVPKLFRMAWVDSDCCCMRVAASKRLDNGGDRLSKIDKVQAKPSFFYKNKKILSICKWSVENI